MNELHPSVSAMGNFLDEQMSISALAQRYYEEEGHPNGRAEEHWLRAEREFHRHHTQPAHEAPESAPDPKTEEAMHLAR